MFVMEFSGCTSKIPFLHDLCKDLYLAFAPDSDLLGFHRRGQIPICDFMVLTLWRLSPLLSVCL